MVDKDVTMDCIKCKEFQRKQGAITELKLLLNDMIELSKRTNHEYSQNFWEGKIRQKITILQGGETK